jgi:hypothetical protein
LIDTKKIIRWIKYCLIWLTAGFSFFLISYYFLWVWNPLNSDEKMMAHFYAHRADFEELVRRYRTYDRPKGRDTSRWDEEGDIPVIYQRAGVERLHQMGPIWLANPYSVETDKWLDNQADQGQAGYLFDQYGELVFELADKGYRRFQPGYGQMWKQILYIPAVPRVERGMLLGPIHKNGSYSSKRVMVDSANPLPKKWRTFGCVYRPIEKNWFIRMCNGN